MSTPALQLLAPPLAYGPGVERFANHPAYVVWHHADTRGDASVQEIHRWHLQRGWAGVGYHYVVRRDGTIERGRAEHWAGAHARGLNRNSIGICFSGSGDVEPIPKGQFLAGLALTQHLLSSYGLCADDVLGHNEVNELVLRGLLAHSSRTTKTCPGRLLDMREVRAKLRGGSVFKTGLDLIRDSGWAGLEQQRVGLVTNHTARDCNGNLASDLLHNSGQVDLRALFSPEHGLVGKAQGEVPHGLFKGLPLYSLHQKSTKRPTPAQIADLDVLVYDVQDAGVRFFTHTSTLAYVLETAAAHKKRVLVLDRPNPLGGCVLEGPLLPKSRFGYNLGTHSLPIRYGLSPGELALMLNSEKRLGVQLEVIRMQSWDSRLCGGPLDSPWTELSPNLQSVPAVLMYPGLGLLEPFLPGTGLDLGRGSAHAFTCVSAPWLDAERVVAALEHSALKACTAVSVKGNKVGVSEGSSLMSFTVQIPRDLRSVELGLAIAIAIWRCYPDQWPIERLSVQLACQPSLAMIKKGAPASEVVQQWIPELNEFSARRAPYLIYDRITS